MKKHLFLREAHILTLAKEMKKHISVIQLKGKRYVNSKCDVIHYKPGWCQPRKLTRPETRTIIASGAVSMHLDYSPAHFSALIPVDTHLRHSTRLDAGVAPSRMVRSCWRLRTESPGIQLLSAFFVMFCGRVDGRVSVNHPSVQFGCFCATLLCAFLASYVFDLTVCFSADTGLHYP